MQQDEIEWIDRYLAGNLDEADQKKFDFRLANDKSFKAAFGEHKRLIGGIESYFFKEKLKNISAKKSPKPRYWPWAVAMALFLLPAAAYWLYQNNFWTTRLAQNYEISEPGLATKMGIKENVDFENAMQEFKLKNYKTAGDKFIILDRYKPNNDTLAYFIGMCNYYQKEYEKAKPYLTENLKKQSVFNQKSAYTLALIALKEKGTAMAIEFLKSTNYENSKELLDKIEQH